MEDLSHKLFREDFMIESLMRILKLHWVDTDDGFCHLEDEQGTDFEANDYKEVEISPILKGLHYVDENNGGEHWIDCDAVLFWGDGCIEFHDANDFEAFNWYNFDEESIRKVESRLNNLVK